MRLRAMLVAVAAICLSWMVSANAFAVVVGDWQLDEVDTRPNTEVLDSDSSGNEFNGHIGNDVVLHESVPGGGYAYRFQGDWRIVNDERLIDWPDDDQLDPGTSRSRSPSASRPVRWTPTSSRRARPTRPVATGSSC